MPNAALHRGLRLVLSTLVLALACWWPSTVLAGKRKCERTVRKGDTVSKIARAAGVTEANLIAANPELKKNPNRLRVGQELDICRAQRRALSSPAKCGTSGRVITHEVGAGETLGAIAARYSVSQTTLRKYNPRLRGRANSMIRVGERLRVCTTLRRYTHRKWFSEGVQLPDGEGYLVRRPGNAWGTQATVDAIRDAIAHYRETVPDAAPVQVGDISRKNGGPLGEHVSHQEGRDVDIGLVYEEPEDETSTRRTIDMERTWLLLRSFAEHDAVSVIFIDYALQKRLYEHAQSIGEDQARLDAIFEYPRGNDDEAVFYHWPGHERHFHVRFRDGATADDEPAEPSDAGELDPSFGDTPRS